MSDDTRPLIERVRNLAARFGAMAIGADKTPHLSRQVGENHRRDARTLHDAVRALEEANEALTIARALLKEADQ